MLFAWTLKQTSKKNESRLSSYHETVNICWWSLRFSAIKSPTPIFSRNKKPCSQIIYGQRSWDIITCTCMGLSLNRISQRPTPQTRFLTRISRIFRFSIQLYREGEREMPVIFKKPGALHCFIRAPRKMSENYEYCITIPGTFVQEWN